MADMTITCHGCGQHITAEVQHVVLKPGEQLILRVDPTSLTPNQIRHLEDGIRAHRPDWNATVVPAHGLAVLTQDNA